MSIIEFLISLITFLLINIPVYAALNKYILKPKGRVIAVLFTILFWIAAFFAQNFPAFIAVVMLLLTVYNRGRGDFEETYMRGRGIWEFHREDIGYVIWASLLFRVAIGALNALYMYILNWLTKYEAKPQDIVTDFTNSNILLKVVLFFVIVVFAPFVEEYAFRYYLYGKKLLPRMPAFAAALISSGVFAAVHYNLGGVPSFLGLGLINCFIFERKGYYGAVLSHMVFNFTSVLLLVTG